MAKPTLHSSRHFQLSLGLSMRLKCEFYFNSKRTEECLSLVLYDFLFSFKKKEMPNGVDREWGGMGELKS